jgi:hypothetical protein
MQTSKFNYVTDVNFVLFTSDFSRPSEVAHKQCSQGILIKRGTINIAVTLTTVISNWTTYSWLVNWSTTFYLQCAFLHDACRPVADAVAEFTWLTGISWYLKENSMLHK